MIEVLLEAERALAVGRLDHAERLYRQASEADPRNSIAVVGLARVALERADDGRAYLLARRALLIDPENEAARRLVERLLEVMRARGDAVPATPGPIPPSPATPAATAPTTPPSPRPARLDALSKAPPRQTRRSILDRLLGR